LGCFSISGELLGRHFSALVFFAGKQERDQDGYIFITCSATAAE
jgi:hypothetical protein